MLTYDDAGQLSTHKDQTGALTTFGYDGAGNMTSLVLPNGVTQSRAYDRASRLATIANVGPAGAIGGFTYGRDNNGNPVSVDVAGPAGVIVTESMRNTYDNYDRLTKTCYTTATTCTAANTTSWTYDKVGNRSTEKVGAAVISTYTYDVADQLLNIVGPDAASFTYNANGDQLTTGTRTYAYNTARQVASTQNNGANAQPLAYDCDGNLKRLGAPGVATDQYWDTVGAMPMLVQSKFQLDPYETKFSHAGSLPISTKFSLSVDAAFYLTDGVGSITNLTLKGTGPANGFVRATYRYTPFGVPRGGTLANSPGGPDYSPSYKEFGFAGQQASGMNDYYMRARTYNPARGSFTQIDPMPYGAGSSFEGSYVYGRNTPLLMNDPTGLRATSCYSGGGQPGACAQKVVYSWGNVQGNPYSNALYDEIYLQKNGVLPAAVMISPNVSCHPNNIGCQILMGPQDPEVDSMVVLDVPSARSLKPVNLPSYKKVTIDMEEVTSGHVKGGSRVSPIKDLFPEGMTPAQIERTVREAYRNSRLVRTQADGIRKLVRGEADGLTIDMWVNTATKEIETAYPVSGGWRAN
jgi:RHS repeat-associated protein